MSKIQIKEIDEEHIEVLVDGEWVCSADHDEDGWAGMEKVEALAESIAKKLGIEFERICL
ncbi:hypothetical protein LCGC14_1477380 [marine sediment metagenome]|uniref:Uncharacterized protein n=1 Tax=marine sediment metagenome TaxID=412755 RepID=A0A0F9JBB8_9ZZZZ